MSTTTAFGPTPGGRAPTAPGRRRRIVLTLITVGWLLGYAVLRAAWTVLGPPAELSAVGVDLVLLTGWPGVGTLLAAAVIVTAQAVAAGRHDSPAPRTTAGTVALTLAGLVLAAALILAGALILLDLVGGVLPGLGVAFFPLGAASRAACIGAAVLIMIHTRRFWLGRRAIRPAAAPRTAAPGWVIGAGYLAVTGCLVRLGAQLVVGLEANPFAGGPSMIVFEVGFLLAGLLLPLALVHRWGRIWPFWVPGLAGRRIPRWLLIIPGVGLGGGMTSYFGLMTAQMIAERIQGRNPFPPAGGLDLPEPFFWVSVPAYLVWGVGLLIGAISYTRLTAPRSTPS